jgi:hypothetical protein
MQQTKKVVGLLLIMFIGIPILVAIIWAVGFTSAALSTDMITELPKEIIETVPGMIQDILDAAKDEQEIFSDNRDRWLKAMAKTEISTEQILSDTGINKWLEQELSVSLNTVNQVIRGEIRSQDVVLNLRPLKKSLTDKALDSYFYKLLDQLPECKEEELARWQEISTDQYVGHSLPPCKPGPEIAGQVLQRIRNEIQEEMPDEVDLFHQDWFYTIEKDWVQKALSFTYTLFIIPALFIILASLIAASSKASFLKWCGISTLIGGIIPLAISGLLKDFIFKFIHWRPIYYSDFEISNLPQIFWDKLERIMAVVGEYLFGPVNKVAGVVCVIGILIFALSFVIPSEEVTSQNKSLDHSRQKNENGGTHGM